VIAQQRQCFLHNEQRAANIDIECDVETFGRDCAERLHEIANTRTREDDVDVRKTLVKDERIFCPLVKLR